MFKMLKNSDEAILMPWKPLLTDAQLIKKFERGVTTSNSTLPKLTNNHSVKINSKNFYGGFLETYIT